MDIAPTWLGVDPSQRASYNAVLQRLSRRADIADAADITSKSIKLIQFGVFSALKMADVDTGEAENAAKYVALGI